MYDRKNTKRRKGIFFPYALHYTISLPDCQVSISRSIHSIASSTLHVAPRLVPFGRWIQNPAPVSVIVYPLYSHCLTVFQSIVAASLLIHELPLLIPCLCFVQSCRFGLCIIVILFYTNITIYDPCPMVILFHEENGIVSLCHVVLLLSYSL